MSATVKILIFNPQDKDRRKLLLVHERGDDTPNGKPPGWGMPGGGERIEEKILYISELIQEKRLDITPFVMAFLQSDLLKYSREELAAVREALEETGFLVKVKELFRESHGLNHQVIVFEGFVAGGVLNPGHNKYAPEIDECDWFFCDALPYDSTQSGSIYRSERARIEKSIAILKNKEYEEEYLKWYLSSGKEVSDGNGGEAAKVYQRETTG